MKKITTIIVATLITSNLFAQITVKISDKMTVDKVYAGIYSNTGFSLDSLKTSCYNSVRFGAMATYQPMKWLSFKYWAMSQVETGSSPWSLQQAWLKFNLSSKLSLETGNMATLETEQRPHPVTGDGQFETSSEASIPGMALNAKLKYQINKDLQLAAGIAERKDKPEYSGRIIYKTFQLSGWYSECSQKLGSAFTADVWRIHSNFVYKQDQLFANNSTIILSKKEEISFYNDIIYDLQTKKLSRCEIGAFKSFNSKFCKGLVGLGYVNDNHSITAHLLVTL